MAAMLRGQIIVGNSSGNAALLNLGSNDYVLTSDGTDIAWEAATTYSAGTGITLSGTTFSMTDPASGTSIDEGTIATDDRMPIWDESASSWKYVTIDNLQDEIDTTGGGGGGISIAAGDTNNYIMTSNGVGDEIIGESTFQYDSTCLEIIAAADATDLLRLTCTDTGSNNFGPIMEIKRTQAGGSSNNDKLGQIDFTGTDDAGNSFFTYASIDTTIQDSRGVSRDGKLRLGASESSTMRYLEWDANKSPPAFQPDRDNEYELGSSSNQWNAIYVTAGGYYASGTLGISSQPIMFTDASSNLYSWVNTGGLVTQLANISDEAVKENITPFNTGLSLINQVVMKSYNWKEDYASAHNIPDDFNSFIGIIAQDIEAIDSEYIKINDEGFKAPSQKWGFEHKAAMHNAIKELSAKNDALEARIAALEAA